MNQQNIPGMEPNQFPHDAGTDDRAPSANPYYGNVGREAAPDLDAGAPQLRSVDEQRLNRKALLFLGGILLLVLAMGFLLVRKSRGGDVEPSKPPRTERVNTPSLPSVVPTPAVAEVPPPAEPIPTLPALPAGPVRPEMPGAEERMEPRGPSLLERRIGGSGGFVGNGDPGAGMGQAGGMDEYTRAMVAQMQAATGQQAAGQGAAGDRCDADGGW